MIRRHIDQKATMERWITDCLDFSMHFLHMCCTGCSTFCTAPSHNDQLPMLQPSLSLLCCCNPLSPLPRVLPVIRKHSISVGRVSRPSAECAEKVLSSSSFATLVLHSSSSSTVRAAAAAGRGVGWLVPSRQAAAGGGGRGGEKVKRCETAASTGSRPQPGSLKSDEGPRLLLL